MNLLESIRNLFGLLRLFLQTKIRFNFFAKPKNVISLKIIDMVFTKTFPQVTIFVIVNGLVEAQ